jgi:hypothetical protein
VITALTTPPTAFVVSGVGVALLVLIAAIFRVIPDTPAEPAGEPQESRRFERAAMAERDVG